MEVGKVGKQLLGARGGALAEKDLGILECLGKLASLLAGGKRGRERCMFLKADGLCSVLREAVCPKEGLLPGFYLIPCLHLPIPGCCLVPLTILPSPSHGIKQIRFPNGGVGWTPGPVTGRSSWLTLERRLLYIMFGEP